VASTKNDSPTKRALGIPSALDLLFQVPQGRNHFKPLER